MQKKKAKLFDASEYLDSEEVIAEYLTAALEDKDPQLFLMAIANVAKARGMSAIAKRTGLGRESLYKALALGAKPRYETVYKVLQSLGVRLVVMQAVGNARNPESPRATKRRRDLGAEILTGIRQLKRGETGRKIVHPTGVAKSKPRLPRAKEAA